MKARIVVLLVTLAAVVFAAVFARVNVVKAQATQPLTIRFQETHYDQSGNVTDFRITTEALRSDGSFAKITQMQSNKPEHTPSGFFEQREILDRVKGLQINASPDLKMKATVPAATGAPDPPRWPSDCVRSGFRTDHQFDKNILGESTVYLVKEGPVGNGKQKITKEWRAPGLNCLLMQREYVITDGPHTSRSVTIALDLQKGEPAEALFTLPPDLVESTPSAMLRAVKEFERKQQQ